MNIRHFDHFDCPHLWDPELGFGPLKDGGQVPCVQLTAPSNVGPSSKAAMSRLTRKKTPNVSECHLKIKNERNTLKN